MTRQAGYKTLDWKHSKVRRNDREDENVSEEFFTEGDSLTEISALVRESMQNSLDAAQDKSKPVTMRFKIGEQNLQPITTILTRFIIMQSCLYSQIYCQN